MVSYHILMSRICQKLQVRAGKRKNIYIGVLRSLSHVRLPLPSHLRKHLLFPEHFAFRTRFMATECVIEANPDIAGTWRLPISGRENS
jgi:hypothetical protein